MGNIHVLTDENIASGELVLRIKEACQDREFLFICGNQSIKDLRLTDDFLRTQFHSSGNQKNILSHVEFLGYLKNEVYKKGHFLSTADSRYILLKVIEKTFADNPVMLRIFKDVRYGLFELFDFLSFSDVDIDEEIIRKISRKHTQIEEYIFILYSQYRKAVKDIVMSVKSGEPSEFNYVLGDMEQDGAFDTYHSKVKDELCLLARQNQAVFLDGFLFFDDIHKYLVKMAVEADADVNLIVKSSANDELNKYLFEQSYQKVFDGLGEMTYPKARKSDVTKNTALDCIKSIYPKIEANDEAKSKSGDGSVEIIEPFRDRDTELRYVIGQISEYLRENGNDDIETIKTLLSDTAIVVAVNKEQYEDRISSILKDTGVFVYKGDNGLASLFGKAVDSNSFKKIYYTRKDFLKERVTFEDGTALDYEQKYNLFSLAFEGIGISKSERPIASYPIGQFVFQIYDILVNGITVEAFRSLLYSNWQYHAGTARTQWDRYISEFQKIEAFLEDKTDLNDWIDTLKYLMDKQPDAEVNPLLKYHPLATVKDFSLSFFYELMCYIKSVLNEIGDISGSLQDHLTALRHKVMNLDAILGLSDDKLSFEQGILKRLYLVIDKIGTSSIMGSLDARYFAENIRYMLNNWEDEAIGEDSIDLRLDVVKLVNVKKYSRVYFVMLEAGKYPRHFTERFPYTKSVIEILGNPKYGINQIPIDYYTLDVHLKIEKYHFINVLDFTGEKLIITMCENEYGEKNMPSIYADDIEMIIGGSIKRASYSESENESLFSFDNPLGTFYVSLPEEIQLRELLEYKLCPRMFLNNQEHHSCYQSRFQLQFYFSAVLFSETLTRFKRYNQEKKKIYTVGDDESTNILLGFFEEAWIYCAAFFPLFNDYEKSDVKDGVKERLLTFIPNLLEHSVKGRHFTITDARDEPQQGNGYRLVLDYDAKIYDTDNKSSRIISNDSFIEFLALKTLDNGESYEHYADMIAALDSGRSTVDRINLTYKMIGKINRQFVSRFIDDGWKRTDQLVTDIQGYDFMAAKAMPSRFCTYCRINKLCMAEYEADREN